MQFQNHRSVETYTSFVDEEVAKALAKGVIAKWPFTDPPTVVNGVSEKVGCQTSVLKHILYMLYS